ncbi:MAG TPA: hypothetical protein GXZ31_01580 [Thermoanaerobacterales bacterium]|nr:hypothetical protein [Thermoanaerobacterales bacterium]
MSVYISRFHSQSNPDGWGIALCPEGDKTVQVIKEPVRAGTSEHADFVKNYDGFNRTYMGQCSNMICRHCMHMLDLPALY